MDTYLGIDTSCYTTSLCLVDETYDIAADERIILTVPKGGRGLSQSNMVYQHTRNLPVLFERAAAVLKDRKIRAVAVTDQPRRRDDSYMPAFLAGLGYARALSAVLQVPLYRLSHQENHLLAVLRSLGKVEQEPFYGIHLSGGTTELVRAVPDDKGLDITRIGGTSDISAGQFIDRMGVAMNLPFPAGVHVDKLSQEFSGTLKGAHDFFKDGEVSFSGPESQGQRLLRDGEADIPRICRWTLATVWRGLSRLLDYAVADGMTHLVAAGGVMSNSYLRQELGTYCQQKHIRLDLAADGFSADNASGAAFWAAVQEGKA